MYRRPKIERAYPMPNKIMLMPGKSKFLGRRWLSIALRSLHLVGVVLTAITIFASSQHQLAASLTTFVTGVGLFGIELWRNRQHCRELAGAFVLLKLLLVLGMILMPSHAAGLFWFLLISSSVISHAPKSFRHKRLFG
jgi:hypothetical protein